MQPLPLEPSPLVWLVAAQFLLYAASWAVVALALRHRRTALLHWCAFMLLLGLGFLLASQRGEPRSWGPYLGANLCFMAGFVALRRGMELFMNQRPADPEHLLSLAVLATAFLAVGMEAQTGPWRVILAYGGGAWLLGRTLHSLRPILAQEFGGRTAWLMASPGVLVVGLFGLRALQQILDLGHNYEMHQATDSNQRLLFGYLFGAALFNFAFMGLVMMRLVARLRDQAWHDPLTSLSNRRALDDAAQRAWDHWRRSASRFAVLSLDLDHFKRINDLHGHQAGDQLLQQVAGRLSQEVRKVDTLARTGGEEFVVLMPQLDREGALAAAERLRLAIRDRSFMLAAGPVAMTTSVGLAMAAAGDADARAVMQRSDRALYRAKEEGRDRCVWLD